MLCNAMWCIIADNVNVLSLQREGLSQERLTDARGSAGVLLCWFYLEQFMDFVMFLGWFSRKDGVSEHSNFTALHRRQLPDAIWLSCEW